MADRSLAELLASSPALRSVSRDPLLRAADELTREADALFRDGERLADDICATSRRMKETAERMRELYAQQCDLREVQQIAGPSVKGVK